MADIGESFVTDQTGNRCFACSQHNAHGLRMRFVRTGEKSAACHYTVADHFSGFEGIVHGGVQAALLDEVMSVATNLHRSETERIPTATAELSLRYRRPVPTNAPLTLRGELVGEDDRDLHLEGAILNAAGETLTTAAGRWRKLRDTTPFGPRAGEA